MKILSNIKGSALAQVLFIFLILSMLSLVILSGNVSDLRIFHNSRESLMAYYVAESGLEIALAKELNATSAITYPYTQDIMENNSTIPVGTCTIYKEGVNTLKSVGKAGKFTKTVKSTFEKKTGGRDLNSFWSNPYQYKTDTNTVHNPPSSGSLTSIVAQNDFAYVYINVNGNGDCTLNNIGGENKNKPSVVVIVGNFKPSSKFTFYGILYVTGEIRLHDGTEIHGYVYSAQERSNAIDVVQTTGTAVINGYIQPPANGMVNYTSRIKTTLPTLKKSNENNFKQDKPYADSVIRKLFGTAGVSFMDIKDWFEIK